MKKKYDLPYTLRTLAEIEAWFPYIHDPLFQSHRPSQDEGDPDYKGINGF